MAGQTITCQECRGIMPDMPVVVSSQNQGGQPEEFSGRTSFKTGLGHNKPAKAGLR
jgi:hypothetical protein